MLTINFHLPKQAINEVANYGCKTLFDFGQQPYDQIWAIPEEATSLA